MPWLPPHRATLLMTIDKNQIETNLRLHVDRLAGLIGARTLRRPKTIQATIGYIEGQWAKMNRGDTPLLLSSCRMAESKLTTKAVKLRPSKVDTAR